MHRTHASRYLSFACLAAASYACLGQPIALASPNRTFPGENGRIVYTSEHGPGGFSQVYLSEADGTGVTQLTGGSAHHVSPQFSPNGARIAFLKETTPYLYDLFVLDPRDTTLTQLSTGGVVHGDFGFHYEWSPDGTQLAYETWSHEIVVVRLDGTRTVIARSGDVGDRRVLVSDPAWSPDGRRVAFSQVEFTGWVNNGRADIHVVNADGTGDFVVTAADLHEFNEHPIWSPDGTRIAHASTFEDEGVWDQFIAVSNVDGTAGVVLARMGDSEEAVAWSAASNRILYKVFDRDSAGTHSVWTMSPDGTSRMRAFSGESEAVFSPDGYRVLYQVYWHPGGNYVSVALDGSDARVVTSFSATHYLHRFVSWGVAADRLQLTLSGETNYGLEGALLLGDIDRAYDWITGRDRIRGTATVRGTRSSATVTFAMSRPIRFGSPSPWSGTIRIVEGGVVDKTINMSNATVDLQAGTGSVQWVTTVRVCFWGGCFEYPLVNVLSFRLTDRV